GVGAVENRRGVIPGKLSRRAVVTVKMAATVKTACLEDVSRKRLDEQENTFLRRPTVCARQRAPMRLRRRSTRMKPHGLRRNEPGEWPTRLSIRQIMSFASNPGQSPWQASLAAFRVTAP